MSEKQKLFGVFKNFLKKNFKSVKGPKIKSLRITDLIV